MYKIIKKYPIESFYDKKETMMEYGYIIYRDFYIYIGKEYLTYNDYIENFYLELYKDNRVYKKWVKHVIFLIIMFIIIYYIYTIR